MSAYFCSKADIDSVLTAAQHVGERWPVPLSLEPSVSADEIAWADVGRADRPRERYLTLLGRLLWRENEKSLRARYEDAEDVWGEGFAAIGEYVFTERPQDSLDQLAQSCVHYAHQSRHHMTWEASSAAHFIGRLASGLARHGANPDASPTAWGLD